MRQYKICALRLQTSDIKIYKPAMKKMKSLSFPYGPGQRKDEGEVYFKWAWRKEYMT